MNTAANTALATEASYLTIPILLLGSLLMMTAITYLFRTWERLVMVMATLYTGGLALWLWQLDITEIGQSTSSLWQQIDFTAPVERMGFVLQLNPELIPIVVINILLVAAAFLLAICVSQGHSFVPFSFILLAGYLALTLLVSGPIAPVLLIPLFLVILSGVGTFVLQAGRTSDPSGPLRALIPGILGFPLFLIAAWYIEQLVLNPQDEIAIQMTSQLLAIGLLILLSPVPLHSAQPTTAQTAPPIVTALLTLLMQLALLHLVYRVMNNYPIVVTKTSFTEWLTWAGLITAIWGGLAAAGTSHPGRLWGYTALHDWGLILLVMVIPDSRSWSLVLFLFGLRTISMLTAAVGLAVLEQHAGELHPYRLQGAGSRLPWSSAAYLLGGLGLAGFPLSAGFTGHWAALQIIAETDWRLAVAILIASGGAIFGFIRTTRMLFGPLENRHMEPEDALSITIALLALFVSVSLAIAPQLLNEPIQRVLGAFGT